MTGAQVIEWLAFSVGQFNQIDPSSKTEQELVNNEFPTYNFDVVDSLNYKIHVTQFARDIVQRSLFISFAKKA